MKAALTRYRRLRALGYCPLMAAAHTVPWAVPLVLGYLSMEALSHLL